MRYLLITLLLAALPVTAQQTKIAVIGLLHSHVWGHLKALTSGEHGQLVGIAEKNPELIAEAKKLGATDSLFFSDYNKMLDARKPQIVLAYVENNRHLEIVKACAPRGIQVIFEKPLASTFKDALEIRRLAKRYHIRVMTNYQMAWWPANYAAKRAADAGDVGRVWRLRGIVGHGGPSSHGPRSKYFFAWLTDPVKNGGGALVDFGCYNALWSLWYLGRPETVYARVDHLRPQTYPKVEDNADFVLSYKHGVGLFEGSWDLPRGFQDLEVFGRKGSIYVKHGQALLRQGRQPARRLRLDPLPPDRTEPVTYMIHCMRNHQPLKGLVALDMNVDVVEIIEAAKESVRTGCAVKLPLPH